MFGSKNVLGWLVLALVPLCAHAADVSGTWTANFDTPMGAQNYTYQLTQKGTALTGTAKNANGESEIKNGQVTADTVTFVESMSMQGMSIDITYTGKIVSPNEIQFSRQVGQFATEQLVAKRAPAPKG